MKIVILDAYTANPGDLSWGKFEGFGELVIHERTPVELTDEYMQGAEIVLTNKAPISRSNIANNPSLRCIGVLATGYNMIDIEAAKEHGVVVTNIPAYSTESVAQLAFALLLEICHHVGHHNDTVKQGKWAACKDYSYHDFPLVELSGLTMGVIGFGNIGQSTARIARAFGMQVLACKRRPYTVELENGTKMAPVEEIFAQADVISLHCPLTEATKGMINQSSIARMKDGVWIINTSRGPLVVEEDIKAALESGKIGYYAADVVSVEPIRADNPLLKTPNTILTPHIAWAPFAARVRLLEEAYKNIQAFLAGTPVNVVNP